MYYNGDYRAQQHPPMGGGDLYGQPVYSGENFHSYQKRGGGWTAFWVSLFTSAIVSAVMHYFALPALDKFLKSKEKISTPPLIGINYSAAKKILTSLGLKIEKLAEKSSSDPPGTIIDQIPKATTPVERGETVKVIVSKGGGTKSSTPSPRSGGDSGVQANAGGGSGGEVSYVRVPRVVGLSMSRAKRKIKKAGLVVGKISWGADEDKPPFWVLDQIPKAGEKVPKGSPVHLTVNPEDL